MRWSSMRGGGAIVVTLSILGSCVRADRYAAVDASLYHGEEKPRANRGTFRLPNILFHSIDA